MRMEQRKKKGERRVFRFFFRFRSETEHMGSCAPNPILFGITSCDSHGYEPSVVCAHCGFSFSSYPFQSADISILLPSLLFLVKSARAHLARLPLCNQYFFFRLHSLRSQLGCRIGFAAIHLFCYFSGARNQFFVAHFGFDIYRPFREWLCWYIPEVFMKMHSTACKQCVCVYSIVYLMPALLLLLLLLGMY